MTTDMARPTTSASTSGELREVAVQRLRKKRGLQAHLLAYVMVNLLLTGIWLATTPGGFYWPVFPLLGWGIGVAFNIWDVYAPGPTEQQIQREMSRLNGR
jgi:hypothetical protein